MLLKVTRRKIKSYRGTLLGKKIGSSRSTVKGQMFGLAVEPPAETPASHTGVPGFDARLQLLASADWEAAVMAQAIGFLLPASSQVRGHGGHLGRDIADGCCCFYFEFGFT